MGAAAPRATGCSISLVLWYSASTHAAELKTLEAYDGSSSRSAAAIMLSYSYLLVPGVVYEYVFLEVRNRCNLNPATIHL